MFGNNIINRPFVLFLGSAVMIMILAPLFQQGGFIDGLLYKTVSTNYYKGDAAFWNMKFSNTSMNPFYEQPPFFFFLTGMYYKLVGNSFITDRLLTVLFLSGSVFLLYKISKLLVNQLSFFLLVLLQLFAIPVLAWAHVNQVIETLVLPFSLLAFYFFLNYRINNALVYKRIMYLIGFSLTVVLLFTTKGFQSCFVIVAPFLYFVFFKEKKSLVFGLLSSIVVLGFLYVLIFVYTPSSEWFNVYKQKRLLASLNNVGATTTYHAEILIRTITELIIPIILVAASLIYASFKKQVINVKSSEQQKAAWILLIIALCGSVPFSITLEQRGFYLIPSFPFFVMAITLFFKQPLLNVYEVINSFFEKKIVSLIILILFIGSLGYWAISPTLFKRDENLVNDLKLIEPFFKAGDTVSIDEDTWNDTALQAYLFMQSNVSAEVNNHHVYYIHDRFHETIPNTNYKQINISTKQYDLFVRKN